MKKTLLLSLTAAATAFLFAGNAMACSPGYKPVKIQGNWVCMIDAAASNNLTAQPQPKYDQIKKLPAKKQKLQKRVR